MEFATVFVGFIGVVFFGLSFWADVPRHRARHRCSARSPRASCPPMGPQYGVPQMVLSRRGFGYWGNVLPAGINALVAGIGWFAVNSVSGALALNALTHMPEVLCLLIVVALQLAVAFLGHNLIHLFERYAFPAARGHLPDRVGLDAEQGAPGRAAQDDSRRVPDRARRDVRLRGGLEPLRLGLHALLQARHEQAGDRLVVRPRRAAVLRAARDRRRGGGHPAERRVRPRTRRPAGPASSRPGSAT